MFWIQENGKDKNNRDYRLFYAEFASDLPLLPTDKKEGTQVDGNSSANYKCALGSECLCIENSNLYILTPSGWTEV